jgi:hypothetical protein
MPDIEFSGRNLFLPASGDNEDDCGEADGM